MADRFIRAAENLPFQQAGEFDFPLHGENIRPLSDQIETFDGGKPTPRAGAARGVMWCIGQAPQRTRGVGLPHRRPDFSVPWRRCASLPMSHIAMRSAPNHGSEKIPVK
jgi:hypothetical protein